MSMIETMRARNKNSGGDSKALPRAPTVPAPVPAPSPTPYYDEEVLRVAQRDFDNKRLIVQLEGERDDWRRKALAAQEECKRLEMRLTQEGQNYEKRIISLTEDRDRRIDDLTARRDEYRLALARFETKIGVQGKAVLELASSISKTILETMDDLKGEKGEGDAARAAGLAAVADAIAEDEPFPHAVTAGPRESA